MHDRSERGAVGAIESLISRSPGQPGQSPTIKLQVVKIDPVILRSKMYMYSF